MKKVDIANRMVLDFVASNLSEDEIFEIKAAQMYRNLSFSKKYASLNESYMAMPMPMYGVGNMYHFCKKLFLGGIIGNISAKKQVTFLQISGDNT